MPERCCVILLLALMPRLSGLTLLSLHSRPIPVIEKNND
jgi:hypothetical protein